jgi:uncharacterized protein (DUF952 family)
MRPLKCAGAVDTVEARSGNSGEIPMKFQGKPQGKSEGKSRENLQGIPSGLKMTRQDSGHVRMIYKICFASAWREAERQGVYRGSADDVRDGFIHFSLPSQVAETARKHFFGQTGLFLIAVDADGLGDALRWEPSRNEELFPHLYGELDLGAVVAVRDLHARCDGYHDIPELAP